MVFEIISGLQIIDEITREREKQQHKKRQIEAQRQILEAQRQAFMGFRERLVEQINLAEMTVEELAVLSGVDIQVIAGYLNGGVPSRPVLEKIAGVFGVSVEYLVIGKEIIELIKDSTSDDAQKSQKEKRLDEVWGDVQTSWKDWKEEQTKREELEVMN